MNLLNYMSLATHPQIWAMGLHPMHGRSIRAQIVYGSSLLFAETNINPTKDISVPRLELVAALLCAKLAVRLREELDFPKNRIFCYSESETTLWWLIKKPNSLLPFVANRVQKIQEFGYVIQYVSTQENLADHLSESWVCSTCIKEVPLDKEPKFLAPLARGLENTQSRFL